MTLEQRGIYIQIVALIYAHGGEIENDPAWIGRLANCSSRLARSLINQLIELDKLQLQGSKITQRRCELELNKKRTHLEECANGGRKSAELRRENRKIKDLVSSDGSVPLPTTFPTPTPSPYPLKKDSPLPPKTQEAKNGTEHEAIPPARGSLNLPVGKFEAGISFEEFWNAYPIKSGREAALVAYQKTLNKTSHAVLLIALTETEPEIWRYRMSPERWLLSESWQTAKPPAKKKVVHMQAGRNYGF